MMNHPISRTSRRLFGAGLFATLLAAASLPAAAQTSPGPGTALLGSTGTTCSYTAVTTFPDGGVLISCGTVVPPPTNSATVTLGSPSPSSIDSVAGGTANLAVGCTGTCSGLVVTLGSTYPGVTVSANSTITFATATTVNATVTAAANTAVGSAPIILTLTSAGTATSTTPAVSGTITRSVQIASTAPPPPGTCNTSATRTVDATGGGTIFFAIAGNGESSAIKFTPTRGLFNHLQFQLTMPATATNKPAPSGYTLTANIAACPGDFTTAMGAGGLCGPRTYNRNSSIHNTSTIDPAKCLLDPAKTYYYNVRFTNATGANTCSYSGPGACATGVNLTYQ